MSEKTPTPYPTSKLRFIDVAIIVVFSCTAIFGLYLFRQNLLQSLDMQNSDPVGFITLRNNVVQRRHDDRVLWDRIFINSPVYPGDLIRAADVSSAAINIANNEIFLGENSIIRIANITDGLGVFGVELREGNISVTSGADSQGIMLDLMGSQVQTTSGTVLDAAAGEDGISIQVNEGAAEIIREGQTREITEGSMIALDTRGEERRVSSVIVTHPQSNARYLKHTQERYNVNFIWSRVNIEPGEILRLEVSDNSNFSRIVHRENRTDNSAQAAFDAGQWHWRLVYGDTVLRRGFFAIIESSGPELISPVIDSVYRFQNQGSLPQIRFQWAGRQEVFRYLVEINETPDFSQPRISRQTTAPSLVLSDLREGTWYWRVKPVYQAVYHGESTFSRTGSFRIEQTSETVTAETAVVIPEAAIERARAGSALSVVGIRPEPVTIPNRPNITGGHPYTVQRGDTLGRISRQFYGDPMEWSRIAQANNITNPDLIYPGQVFLIP
ncbi:MAG: LysM peptidoglycan-binding domain-containing protein [Treponema sp.]|nr:LysM peptidoglycan-binding domain-containing protein [Treponema sp.]